MKKKSRKKRWILIIIVLLLVGTITAVMMKPKDTSLAVTVGEASKGDITSIVTATGKVFPEVEVRISSEVSGEIVELPVRDGQQVSRGELLVRVNPDTLDAQVKQQEASLQALRSNSAQSRAEMLQAELDLQRIADLNQKGFVSQDQLEQSKTLLEVRRASLEASMFRIQQQEMSLKEARDQLAKASSYAPIDGTITRLNAELGDRVVGTGQFEGTEIVRVANLNDMEVRVEVSETDITAVKVGDQATIEIDALPNHKFKGSVSEIANSAQTNEAGGQEQLTVFLVKVKLEEVDARIRPGMTATADISTKTVTDVVRVPLQSVTVRPRDVVAKAKGESAGTPRDSGPEGRGANGENPRGGNGRRGGDNMVKVVFVIRDNSAYLVPVETGIADSRFIEITSGLNGGEKIATGSYGVITRELNHESTVREEAPTGPRGPRP